MIILGPVLIGMFLRSRFPSFAARMERPIRIFSIVLLAALVLVSVIQQWDAFAKYFPVVGLACLLFNRASLVVRFIKTVTNKTVGFFRLARREEAA